MNTTLGIIDLGSNTFHLIIAELAESGFEIIYKERSYVFLAQSGIDNIAQDAFDRGMDTLDMFYRACRDHKVENIIAVGTAALRTAGNGSLFIKTVYKRYGIGIDLIDGNREAELIYKGISAACPCFHDDALMVDIGGGSTEFILTKKGKIVFQDSLLIGLGVVRNAIPLQDPATENDIRKIKDFISDRSRLLSQKIREFSPVYLIGGSGTFDVIAEATAGSEFQKGDCASASVNTVKEYITPIIHSTEEERMLNDTIPQKRVNLAVYAFIMIDWILEQTDFSKIVFSKYALKEGLLKEYYEEWIHKK